MAFVELRPAVSLVLRVRFEPETTGASRLLDSTLYPVYPWRVSPYHRDIRYCCAYDSRRIVAFYFVFENTHVRRRSNSVHGKRRVIRATLAARFPRLLRSQRKVGCLGSENSWLQGYHLESGQCGFACRISAHMVPGNHSFSRPNSVLIAIS